MEIIQNACWYGKIPAMCACKKFVLVFKRNGELRVIILVNLICKIVSGVVTVVLGWQSISKMCCMGYRQAGIWGTPN